MGESQNLKRVVRRAFRAALCGALIFAPLNASADELDDQKAAAEQQLEELTQERGELEKNLEGTNEKLKQAVLALHDVEKRLPVVKAELVNAQNQSQAAGREVAVLGGQLADAEAELAQVQQMRTENEGLTKEAHRQMAALARQAARGDQLTTVGLITGAQSASDFVAQSTANAAVTRAQSRTLAAIQDADAAARNTEARITAIADQITQLKVQADAALAQRQAAEQVAIDKQNEISKLYAKQNQLKEEIEDQRDEELQELEDAIADQEAIQQTIRELAEQQVERDRIIEERRRQEEADRIAQAEAARQAAELERQRLQAEYEAQQRAYEEALKEYEAQVKAQAEAKAKLEAEAEAEDQESEGSATEGTGTEGEATESKPAKPAIEFEELVAPTPPPPLVLPDLPPEAGPLGAGYGSFLGWPTTDHTVTSSYGYRYHPKLHFNRLHAGTDLRAQCGTPVYAAQSGIVVKREWYGTGGNMILIDHGKDDAGANVMTRYLHLSGYNVAANQWVDKGQVVGFSGATGGVSTGCHLHFEVYIDGNHVDPMTKLN